MKLALPKLQNQGTSSWDEVVEHGVLRKFVDKTDKFFFSKQNLKNDKRLTIIIRDKADNLMPLACSKYLSNLMKPAINSGKITKNQAMSVLFDLRVIETEINDEQAFFVVPDFNGSNEFSLADLEDTSSLTLADLEETVAI